VWRLPLTSAELSDITLEARRTLDVVQAGHLDKSLALWNLCFSIACDVRALCVLASTGADVNVVGLHGWRPLHVAAMQNNARAVQALARAGARLEERCNVRASSRCCVRAAVCRGSALAPLPASTHPQWRGGCDRRG
jgi:hypothetical protein